MWANEPKMARKWTDEHGSTPVKAKAGKYQEFKHPQHDILPLEHMEEKVSAKERVEKLLDDRKKKKESKKKLAKDGPHYVPGWKPNLSVKAAEGELVRQKTQGTGAAVTGIMHYTMKGMPTAQTGQLVQVPTRGAGAAISGDQHYVMQGMDAAKTGKMIKAKESKWVTVKPKTKVPNWDKSMKHFRSVYDLANELKTEDKLTTADLENARKIIKSGRTPPHHSRKTGGPIKAKKGIFHSTATSMYDKPPGWDVKKISDKTHKKLTKVWKHRETGGWKSGAGKDYRKYLKDLKKITPTKLGHQLKGITPEKMMAKSKSFHFKDAAKPSDFLHRRMTLAGYRSVHPGKTALSILKKAGKRTGIGKAVVAASVVAGAYEAGKRKLFTKKDKKKVDKKSIGGETVVMKSGGGYIDELL
jgi:uncharacterized Zn-binding protein involved in type VI secretion